MPKQNTKPLSKKQQIKKIMRLFPTERYKQFSYQIRPFFTMGMTLLLLGLGWLHIVNFVIIAWIMAVFILDNVALTSIISVLRAGNHLAQGRKQMKAIMMLVMVGLGLVLGASLGYLVFAHMPLVISIFTSYINLTGCSPFLISMGALLGGYVSHTTHKIPLFWAIFFGGCLGSIIPLSIPIAFEVIYFSAIAAAFFATIISKQSMRLYYKYYYGDTNADGYNIAKNPSELREFIETQSHKFGITTHDFQILSAECRKRIKDVKKVDSISSFWREYMGDLGHISNSYKDIYHTLWDAKLSNPEEIKQAKKMIADSNLPPKVNTLENKKRVNHMLRFGTFFEPNYKLRMKVHQFEIAEAGSLDSTLLAKFQA